MSNTLTVTPENAKKIGIHFETPVEIEGDGKITLEDPRVKTVLTAYAKNEPYFLQQEKPKSIGPNSVRIDSPTVRAYIARANWNMQQVEAETRLYITRIIAPVSHAR